VTTPSRPRSVHPKPTPRHPASTTPAETRYAASAACSTTSPTLTRNQIRYHGASTDVCPCSPNPPPTNAAPSSSSIPRYRSPPPRSQNKPNHKPANPQASPDIHPFSCRNFGLETCSMPKSARPVTRSRTRPFVPLPVISRCPDDSSSGTASVARRVTKPSLPDLGAGDRRHRINEEPQSDAATSALDPSPAHPYGMCAGVGRGPRRVVGRRRRAGVRRGAPRSGKRQTEQKREEPPMTTHNPAIANSPTLDHLPNSLVALSNTRNCAYLPTAAPRPLRAVPVGAGADRR